MNARAYTLAAAAGAGILIYAFANRPANTNLPSSATEKVHGTATAPANGPSRPEPAAHISASPPSGTAPELGEKTRPVADLAPSTEELRREVEQDVHATPEAMVKFSVLLMEREKAAAENDNSAREFFAELQACALNSQSSAAVQALCLLNAKRLAQARPSLNSEYDALERRSNPKAAGLMKDLPL
jgi:hypothetical protein